MQVKGIFRLRNVNGLLSFTKGVVCKGRREVISFK